MRQPGHDLLEYLVVAAGNVAGHVFEIRLRTADDQVVEIVHDAVVPPLQALAPGPGRLLVRLFTRELADHGPDLLLAVEHPDTGDRAVQAAQDLGDFRGVDQQSAERFLGLDALGRRQQVYDLAFLWVVDVHNDEPQPGLGAHQVPGHAQFHHVAVIRGRHLYV